MSLLQTEKAKALARSVLMLNFRPKFSSHPHKKQVLKVAEKAATPLAKTLSEAERVQITLDLIRFRYGVEMAAKAALDFEKQGKLKRLSKGYRRFLQLLQLLQYMFWMYPEYMITSPLIFLFLSNLLHILKNAKLTREERESVVGLILALTVWLLGILSPTLLPLIFYLLVFLVKQLSLTAPLEPYALKDILQG